MAALNINLFQEETNFTLIFLNMASIVSMFVCKEMRLSDKSLPYFPGCDSPVGDRI